MRSALQDNPENVAVAYSAEGLENIVATSMGERIIITSDVDAFSAALAEDETGTVNITADLVKGHEGMRTQSLTAASGTRLAGRDPELSRVQWTLF